jgi:hypothetical protein
LRLCFYYRDRNVIEVKPDRARNSNICCITGQLYNSRVTLYRDTCYAQKVCTRMAKTAPCFAHYDLRDRVSSAGGSYLPVSVRSAPFTYFIAGPLCLSDSMLLDRDYLDNQRLSITAFGSIFMHDSLLWNNLCCKTP